MVDKKLSVKHILKEKYVRCNQSPLMNKELRKVIMACTRLHNKYMKDMVA